VPLLRSPEDLRRLLSRAETIAVVGLSADPSRDSSGVAEYLKAEGYRILPVNPGHARIIGERAYPSLSAIPEEERRAIDIVDVFRRSEAALDVAREAARLKLPAIWFQLGVATPEAIEEADRGGLEVVAESCIKVAHRVLKPERPAASGQAS
jgi:predicted CoA-binding protein